MKSVQAPTLISATGISKRFVIRKDKSLKERIVNMRRSNKHKEDFYALKDVDFELRAGETVGLLGANGSGKSTLLKVLGGILLADTGRMEYRGRMAALVELGAGFHPDLTGRENVYLNAALLGLNRAATDRLFNDILEFSEIGDFVDSQVKFYSSGMYVRLAFAVAVHVDPDVLLVDEVLAVGDEQFQKKCIDRIKEFQAEGRSIVFVSHSAEQVVELCDRALVLSHGRVIYEGATLPAVKALRQSFGN